jgi:hypothetical protein
MKRGGKCSGGLCPNSTHHIEVATTISSFDKKKHKKTLLKVNERVLTIHKTMNYKKVSFFLRMGGNLIWETNSFQRK